MDQTNIKALLDALKDPDETVRERATQSLWKIWFEAKGLVGVEAIRQAQVQLEWGDLDGAEATLTQLIASFPDFAEAWNRRAVLYYLQGRYTEAIADCQQVLQLNPVHFGAWHGQGLCHLAQNNYAAALQSFRAALAIQPYAVENQRWILECNARLY